MAGLVIKFLVPLVLLGLTKFLLSFILVKGQILRLKLPFFRK
jgi:hypothetical protein